MGTNIKNPETHKAIQELAEAMGVSQTQAVDVAVREKLQAFLKERDMQERLARVMDIARDAAPRFKHLKPGEDPTAFLYDEETGLPK